MRLLATACLAALAASAGCHPADSEAERFAGLATRCLEALRAADPEQATLLGDHRWDHLLTDRRVEAVAARVALHRSYLDSLRAIDATRLPSADALDRHILARSLESALYTLETLRPQDWDPLWYNPGAALHALIAREHAPRAERMRDLKSRLEALPQVLRAARTNLRNPPRVHAETAIVQNEGNISLLRDDLGRVLADVPELAAELAAARASAVAALEEYGEWLRRTLLPEANGEFRLGPERFRRLLALNLDTELTPEEILRDARLDLAATRREMAEVARSLSPQLFPGVVHQRRPTDDDVIRAVLDRLTEDRPTCATAVATLRGSLESATAFVRERGLVSLPDEPLEVVVMPGFQRGAAIAHCDAPGPLEPDERAFYAIALPSEDWPPARADAFFREYNDYMLQALTLHEAVPGHHVQMAHANRYRGSTQVRSILANVSFLEGWATYAEQIMTEAGYGGPPVRLHHLKLRLRMLLNAVLDQGVHMRGLTEAEALDLLMREGFQEEGEARRKWRRAALSATQLSAYYVGNREINLLRDEARARQGVELDLREFNDRLLSFGAPAPQHLRALMGL